MLWFVAARGGQWGVRGGPLRVVRARSCCRLAERAGDAIADVMVSRRSVDTALELAFKLQGQTDFVVRETIAAAADGNGSGFDSKDVKNYALTLVARQRMTVDPVVRLASLLTSKGAQVLGFNRLCRGLEMRAMEISLDMPSAREKELRDALWEFTHDSEVDAVLQRDGSLRRSKLLAIFDLDSTLIQIETADTIAECVGKGEECANITVRAMNGELEFGESLRQRVELLAGVHVSELEAVKDKVVYTTGAYRLTKVLRKLGCTVCICSGGFTFLTDHVRQELRVDASFSNVLEVVGDRLTGRTTGPIVDAQKKEDVLRTLRTFLKLEPEQVLAVGDGANDLPMLAEAGLGVAFNARPRVQRLANAKMNQESMDTILYLLGLNDDEIAALATD